MARNKFFADIYREKDTYDFLDESLEFINEADNYTVKYNKKTQYKRMLKLAELKLARDNGDILFNKYLKASKIRRECRAAIHEKYGTKAAAQVRMWVKARKQKGKGKAATTSAPDGK